MLEAINKTQTLMLNKEKILQVFRVAFTTAFTASCTERPCQSVTSFGENGLSCVSLPAAFSR